MLVGCGKKKEDIVVVKPVQTTPKFESQLSKENNVNNPDLEDTNEKFNSEAELKEESEEENQAWDSIKGLSEDSIDYIYINGSIMSLSDFFIPDESYLYSYLAGYTIDGGIVSVNDTVFSEYTDEYKFYECVNTNGLTTYNVDFKTFTITYNITYENEVFTKVDITITPTSDNCTNFYIVDNNGKRWFINEPLVFNTEK